MTAYLRPQRTSPDGGDRMTTTSTCCVCGRTMPAHRLKPEWVRTGRNPTGRWECRDRQVCLHWKTIRQDESEGAA